MNTKRIDGKCYARMLFGGAAMLSAHTQELNDLNVFPVCDGDTGTNMLRTMEGGLAGISADTAESVGKLSETFAKGTLLSARGNSGVILSQIFAGINDSLRSCEQVNASLLAEAYTNGIKKSYAAVQNPTEGTILTVFRESTEYAKGQLTENSSVEDFFRLHIQEAQRSLARTKELLPALAEADVVDSGAAGYLYIAEGMYKALGGAEVTYTVTPQKEQNALDIESFGRDSILEFGYCTEFLLRLMTSKVDPDAFDIQTVLSVLHELGGESIVAYKQGDIVKVHVHTFRPGDVLARMQAFGEFLTVKIENMSLGHSDTSPAKKKKNRPFSVVAVATGDGMEALFSQMGADRIVSGGQTANPSIEEFVEAFRACDSEHILVLPNNKNVILAARQAAELYRDAVVHVLETKNLMQGYSALSVITPGITDMDALLSGAERAAEGVIDGEITRAVRDATVDGLEIRCGDYMAISQGHIVTLGETAEDAVLRLLELSDTDLCEIITLFVGKDAEDERRYALIEQIREIYDECELVVYEGGQEVYDYLVAIE